MIMTSSMMHVGLMKTTCRPFTSGGAWISMVTPGGVPIKEVIMEVVEKMVVEMEVVGVVEMVEINDRDNLWRHLLIWNEKLL